MCTHAPIPILQVTAHWTIHGQISTTFVKINKVPEGCCILYVLIVQEEGEIDKNFLLIKKYGCIVLFQYFESTACSQVH